MTKSKELKNKFDQYMNTTKNKRRGKGGVTTNVCASGVHHQTNLV